MTQWHQSQLQKLYEQLHLKRAEGLTQLEAAKVLDVTKSIYVHNLLEELVAGGYAVKVWGDKRKHPAWVWRLPDGTP